MERTRVYGLGPARVDAMEAFQATGYSFRPQAGSPGRPGRPHAVGLRAEGKHRIELIGPEEHIFKAVLIADLTADVQAAAAQFLGYFAPDWDDAGNWFARQSPLLAHGAGVEASLPRLHVHLRKMGHQDKAVLTLSWVPGSSDGIPSHGGAGQ